MKRKKTLYFLGGVAFTMSAILLMGAGGKVMDPTGIAPDRYSYYPGTEELKPDEIRLIAAGIGETYDGPLSMATDNMVWNIRRDEVIERMVISPDNAWDVEGPGKKLDPDRTRKSEYTPFILGGSYDMTDVNKGWADEFMQENGLSPDILKADHKQKD